MKVIIIFALFFSSCAIPTRKDTLPPETTPTQQVPARVELRVVMPEEIDESYRLQAVDGLAKENGLPKLYETILPDDDLEIRVQVGFGLYGEDAFVLKRSSGEWEATHIRGMLCHLVNNNKGKGKLPPPRSGWDGAWAKLKQAGILSMSGVKDAGWQDGTSYIVETNLNKTYLVYAFGNPDKLKNGQGERMIEVANVLADEFGLKTFKVDHVCN